VKPKLHRFLSWYEAHNKQSFHLRTILCANLAFGCLEPIEGGLFAIFGTKLTFSLDGMAAIRQDGQPLVQS
jgi:hypothetical protein